MYQTTSATSIVINLIDNNVFKYTPFSISFMKTLKFKNKLQIIFI